MVKESRLKESKYLLILLFLFSCNQKSFTDLTDKGNMALTGRDTVRAISFFSEAIKVAPDKAQIAYKNRGACYLMQGKYSEALSDLDNAIRLNKNDKDAYSFRYELEHKTHQYFAEIKDLNMVLSLDSNDINALNNLGVIYDKQGDKFHAFKLYKKALSNDSNYAMAHNNLGMLLADVDSLDMALVEYGKAINLDTKNADYYYNRSCVYLTRKEAVAALADLNMANSLEPHNPETLNSIAIANFLLKNKDEACKNWRQAYNAGKTEAMESINKYCK